MCAWRVPVQVQLDRDAPRGVDRSPGARRIDQRRRPRSGGHEHRVGGDRPPIREDDAGRAAAAFDRPRRRADHDDGPTVLGQRRPRGGGGRGRHREARGEPDGGRAGRERGFEPLELVGLDQVRLELGEGFVDPERLRAGALEVRAQQEQPSRLVADREPVPGDARERAVAGEALGDRALRGPGRTDAGSRRGCGRMRRPRWRTPRRGRRPRRGRP